MSKGSVVLGVIVLFVAGSLVAQELEPQPFKFSWQPTQGAGGYLAEVKDLTGKPITQKQVTNVITSITFQLVPGSYQLKMTTLNRLLEPESSTDWVPIHVPAAGPPIVGIITQISLVPGTCASIDVPVQGLAQDATASLVTPAGASIPLTIGAVSAGMVKLSIPVLTERGEYSILITNPPKLTTTIAGKLSVHYPDPIISSVIPLNFSQSQVAQSIQVNGRNFSGEATVVLESEDGRQLTLPIHSRSDTHLSAVIAPGQEAGSYKVLVSNAADELPVTAEKPMSIASSKFGSLIKPKGTLAITSISGGTVALLGQSETVPPGETLPVKDVDVGKVKVSMTYLDGKTEDRTVNVLAGQDTHVVFEEVFDATLVHKTIQLAGKPEDFSGVETIFHSPFKQHGAISGGTICRDDDNLYIKIDFASGAPHWANGDAVALVIFQGTKRIRLQSEFRNNGLVRVDVLDVAGKKLLEHVGAYYREGKDVFEMTFPLGVLKKPTIGLPGFDFDFSKPVGALMNRSTRADGIVEVTSTARITF